MFNRPCEVRKNISPPHPTPPLSPRRIHSFGLYYTSIHFITEIQISKGYFIFHYGIIWQVVLKSGLRTVKITSFPSQRGTSICTI